MMIASIKARYANGVLTPLEPLDLEEGAEVTVSIDTKRLSLEERIKITMSSAGGWAGSHDPEELKRMIYEARITGSRDPVDL